MKEENIKELIDNMFENAMDTAIIIETKMSSNDIIDKSNFVVGGLTKLLNDLMKVGDLHGILKEENIKELIDKMNAMAITTIIETQTSSNDIIDKSNFLVGGLAKSLNGILKLGDLYGILNEEKSEQLTEIMADLFHLGIVLGILRHSTKILPIIKRMLEENAELQQKLEEFQKRTLKRVLEENTELQQKLEEFQTRRSKFELNTMFG